MKNTTSVSVVLGDKTLTFETGLLARQAAGQATCQIGETMVFSAVSNSKKPREGIDFFPLQIEYRERFYAAGRFPGGYFKREGRPTEKEILTARITDRPIRPLFAEGYYNEVQINNALMSVDGENESDILSVNAASAALMLSELPFLGPLGAVRVGRIDGQFILNPTQEQTRASDIDLIYVGRRDLPMMIEGSAKEAKNADMVAAMKFGHEAVVKICDAQLELRAKMGLPPKTFEEKTLDAGQIAKLNELSRAELTDALFTVKKAEREDKMSIVFDKSLAQMQEIYGAEGMTEKYFKMIFDAVEIDIVRKGVLDEKRRMDGRAMDEIRPLSADVGILPRVHGSALFSRGETQAMAIITLGTGQDEQSMDGLTGGDTSKRFTLHYNFPPYSVGEVRRLGGINRREIGHGALAERSIEPMMPKDYPYSVRIVSEIMGSNGSSSMASVCVGTLALMDAGVPIEKPVAGISIGLVTGEGPEARPADRYPRRRRSLRRHGLQGRRHARGHHRLPGRPEDPRPRLGSRRRRLRPGAKRPARRSSTPWWRSSPAPRPELSPYAPAHRGRADQPREDRRPHRPRRQEHPPHHRDHRRPDRHRRRQPGKVSIFSNNKESLEAAMREVQALTAEAEVGARSTAPPSPASRTSAASSNSCPARKASSTSANSPTSASTARKTSSRWARKSGSRCSPSRTTARSASPARPPWPKRASRSRPSTLHGRRIVPAAVFLSRRRPIPCTDPISPLCSGPSIARRPSP